MSTHPITQIPESPVQLPFPAPCRTLSPSAPLRWLRLGWDDLTRAPRLSLTYGLVLMLMSLAVTGLAWQFGTLAMYFGLATGFVFVGPLLAVGLYSISRQLEAGLTPVMGYCVQQGWRNLQGLLGLGMVLLIVLVMWARVAAMVSVFIPPNADRTWQDLLPFLGIGSAIGAMFTALVFAVSAFSFPMLLDRKVDPVTAVVSSFHAVMRNKGTMLVWAGMIGVAVLSGFATAFLSFVVLLPVIGHATWHAYRETIDASAWPKNLPGDSNLRSCWGRACPPRIPYRARRASPLHPLSTFATVPRYIPKISGNCVAIEPMSGLAFSRLFVGFFTKRPWKSTSPKSAY
jgi:uncharacterized membrane protein